MRNDECKPKSLGFNMILNVIRQACTVLFPLITFPYVARILGASNYGVISYSQSIISYFSLIAALGVISYAVREGAKLRETDKINTFCSEVYTINIYSTIVAYVLLIVTLIFVDHLHPYYLYITIISSGLIITTIGADWVNSIFEDYLYITLRYIFVQILSLIALFLFVRNEDDLLVYVVIYTFSMYAGFLLNVFYIRRYVKIKFLFRINPVHIKPILVLFANAIAIVIYVNSDITILEYFVTSEQIGVYSFATRIYTAFKQLINAFIIVTIPRVSAYVESDIAQYHLLIRKLFSAMLIILLPITAFVAMESKEIIFLLGGNQYINGEMVLKILSISLLFAILGSFVSNDILLVNRKEKYCLISTVISAVINVLLNFIFIPMLGISAAALTTLIAEAVCYVLQAYFGNNFVESKKLIDRDLIGILIGAFIIGVICFASKGICNVFESELIAFVYLMATFMVSIIIYFFVLIISRNKMILGVVKKMNIVRR